MNRKYALVDLEPNLSLGAGLAHGGNDIVFDWTPIEIPTGACSIKMITSIITGTNGAAGNTHDLNLYFARSINGVAPTTFGTEHGAAAAATTVGFRKNIIGYARVDFSTTDDADYLVSYNVLGSRTAATADNTPLSGEMYNVVLQGDPMYSSTKGYQTIWVAGGGAGAFDFGTDVDLNMGSSANVAADMTGADVALTVSGTDATIVFSPGDQIVGHTNTVTMEVVSVTDATNMIVKNVSAQIDHAEQLMFRNPIKMMIGLEY